MSLRDPKADLRTRSPDLEESMLATPIKSLTWNTLESFLVDLLTLPHNLADLQTRTPGKTPAQRADELMQEIRSAFVDTPSAKEFIGPHRFLRAAGPDNSVYGGSWWFDEALL